MIRTVPHAPDSKRTIYPKQSHNLQERNEQLAEKMASLLKDKFPSDYYTPKTMTAIFSEFMLEIDPKYKRAVDAINKIAEFENDDRSNEEFLTIKFMDYLKHSDCLKYFFLNDILRASQPHRFTRRRKRASNDDDDNDDDDDDNNEHTSGGRRRRRKTGRRRYHKNKMFGLSR